jgi:SAM-dependent methyltransferase
MRTLQHPQLRKPIPISSAKSNLTREELVALYWQEHPRFRFLKNSPTGERFFDVGAGSGGLATWKNWQVPLRPDIEMHGCDLFPAVHQPHYAAFHTFDFDGARFPYEDGYFGAALSSHVIEHLCEQTHFSREILRVLRPGGRVYIETPTDTSCELPPRDFFLREGLPTTTINFFDDSTHTRALSPCELVTLFKSVGFDVQESGTIRVQSLEEDLIAQAAACGDEELGSYGLWSMLGFAHYGIFIKPV